METLARRCDELGDAIELGSGNVYACPRSQQTPTHLEPERYPLHAVITQSLTRESQVKRVEEKTTTTTKKLSFKDAMRIRLFRLLPNLVPRAMPVHRRGMALALEKLNVSQDF